MKKRTMSLKRRKKKRRCMVSSPSSAEAVSAAPD
jgi:hypothetical protein